MDNAWFYYFSSLAQTIAAVSALLVALAIIRLQSLANSLSDIQRLLAELFFKIGIEHDYQVRTSPHFLNDNWREYFREVEALGNQPRLSSSPQGAYRQSKAFLDSLIAEGRKFEARIRRLRHMLVVAFGGTVILAGAAVLVLPIARSGICPSLLLWSWAGSGFLLLLLLGFYIALVAELRREK